MLVALSLHLGLLNANAQEGNSSNWPEWVQVKFNLLPIFDSDAPRIQLALEFPINEKISFFNEFGIAYYWTKPENETRSRQEYVSRAGFRRSFQNPMKSRRTWYLELYGHHHQSRSSVATPADMLRITPALNPLNLPAYHEKITHIMGFVMSIGWQKRINVQSRFEVSAGFGGMYRMGYGRAVLGRSGERPLMFPSSFDGEFQFSHGFLSLDARYCFAFFPKGRS